jgi:hypothetical protein
LVNAAQRVLDAALRRLSEEERRLLSRGASIDRLSSTFGGHRSTRARQLVALRHRELGRIALDLTLYALFQDALVLAVA